MPENLIVMLVIFTPTVAGIAFMLGYMICTLIFHAYDDYVSWHEGREAATSSAAPRKPVAPDEWLRSYHASLIREQSRQATADELARAFPEWWKNHRGY